MYTKSRGSLLCMPVISQAQRSYLWILLATAATTVLLMKLSESLAGIYGLLFLAAAFSQSHYIASYFFGAQSWKLLPSRERYHRVALFGGVSFLYFLLFYYPGVIGFEWTLFIIVLVGFLHCMRDYGFFYEQLTSDFRSYARPLWPTVILTLGYCGIFLSYFSLNPAGVYMFRGDPIYLSPIVGEATFFLFFAAIVAYFGFVRKSANQGYSKYFWIVLLLPVGFFLVLVLTPVLSRFIELIEFIYFILIWHYVLWYVYTWLKVKKEGSRMARISAETAVDKVVLWWRETPMHYVIATGALNVVVVAPFFILLAGGFWANFAEGAAQSFLWGLYGYPFWAFAHIVFNAFPKQHRSA